MRTILVMALLALCLVSSGGGLSTVVAADGQGCCSSHNGECGCESGYVLCCDSTLSKSCRCNQD